MYISLLFDSFIYLIVVLRRAPEFLTYTTAASVIKRENQGSGLRQCATIRRVLKFFALTAYWQTCPIRAGLELTKAPLVKDSWVIPLTDLATASVTL